MSLPKLSTMAILLHVAGHADESNFALAICKEIGSPSGTVVPALGRLTDRDGLLQRREQPTKTGRPRLVYSLTDAGQAEVETLTKLLRPRAAALRTAKRGRVTEVKLNTSSLWLISAALMNDGAIIGYSEALRPLTHQAAYAELARLQPFGIFVETDGRHVLTDVGNAVANEEGAKWAAVLDRCTQA